MNTDKLSIAMSIFVLTAMGLSQRDVRGEEKLLQIYLLRSTSVNSEVVMVRDVGILKGDEETATKAGAITLCRIGRPCTEITLDKQVIMSRLASNGISASEVIVSGADSVIIARKGRVIVSDDFVKVAQQELAKEPNDVATYRWKAAWPPKEFVVDGAEGDVKLVSRRVSSNSQSQVHVLVSVMRNGKEIGVREVAFAVQYKNQRAVAITDIQSGTLISADNVRIEAFESSLPQRGWAQPYGLVARRQIRSGDTVGADSVESTKSPVLVSRNQGVVIQIKQPGLLITAMGQALEDGRANECVKIRNIDSQRVLLARVNEDGTVEPVY
ncbi:MAG: flagellar basal body P-ring formation chaperone FlgA [Sedimentisphaerales bacterium]|nr:flagellar basal body P-ring formation chaperone FlgA [Sedimentisphaerales bacterium]